MTGGSRRLKAAAWAVVQWILTTVVIRLIGLGIDEFRSWSASAVLAAAAIATGELSDRWHRRRRRRKARTSSDSVATRE
ncbi:hypothetical protein ACFY1U_30210 [Streptomyces sp. NPDC001351]|uniref:hypothetical protein n=1 Tax=Streptomyces sp. NPDC001351 TaxID=3364564 RepID=UPI00367BBFF2